MKRQLYDRIPCLVPHCRRGTRRFPDGEFICGKHWPLVSRKLKLLMRKAKRRQKWQLCATIWRKMRRQAIEGAFGL